MNTVHPPGLLVVEPLIDKQSAAELLRLALPVWVEVLEHIEESGGRLKMRSEFSAALDRLKAHDYPRLYESPLAAGLLIGQAIMGPEALAEFSAEVGAATPAERGEVVVELVALLDGADAAFDVLLGDSSPGDGPELSPEEQARGMAVLQALFACTVAMFYEYLSVAVHGERLTSLVAKAKEGDDSALLRAVQIDPRMLVVLPYFKQRFERAVTGDEEAFREKLFRKQVDPPYKGRLTHKALFMAFAFLESCGLLHTFGGEELLDFCCALGCAQGIEDVKNLRKLLARYRRFQSQARLSTP